MGLVSTLVLARVLVPRDFGLVAIVMAVVALLEVMTNFGFDSALIAHQNPVRDYYDTVWSITVLFGLVTATALLLLSGPVAIWYADPRLSAVMQVVALSAFIGSLRNVGCVDFRRNLEASGPTIQNMVKISGARMD